MSVSFGDLRKLALAKAQETTADPVATPVKKKAPVVRKADTRPAEVSSARPISLRPVVKKATVARDPRFSEHSGELNLTKFAQSYSWMDTKMQTELDALQTEINECEDADKKAELVARVKKDRATMLTRKRAAKVVEVKRKLKAVQKDAVQRGQTPYFYNTKTVERIAKSEFAKDMKTQKLHKHLINKRKKAAAKGRAPKSRRE